MTSILMIFGLPPAMAQRYYDGVRAAFPDITVTLVDNVRKADPYLADMDVLITHGPYLADRADHVLSNAPKLKWIQGIGTGVDNFADRPALRDDVTVTNIHGVHGNPMSEAAFGAMLALSRKIPRSVRNQDQQEMGVLAVAADHRQDHRHLRHRLDRTDGRAALQGVRHDGDRHQLGAQREVAGFDRMVHRDDLIEAVRELDYFLLLTPYSPETHNIIGAKVFAAMKPQSFLINHARGGVVDEVALLAALREGRIAGAALDVFATEPLPQDHPFWAMENVLITCHQSATHDASVATNLPIIVENIRRFIGGRHRRHAQRGAPGADSPSLPRSAGQSDSSMTASARG